MGFLRNLASVVKPVSSFFFFFCLSIIGIPASAETVLWQLPVWGSSQRV